MEFLRAVFCKEKINRIDNIVYITPIVANGSSTFCLSVKIFIAGIMYFGLMISRTNVAK